MLFDGANIDCFQHSKGDKNYLGHVVENILHIVIFLESFQ